MIFFCGRRIFKCTGCFKFQYAQGKLGLRKGWFGHAFRHRVTNFKPHFLSPQVSELKNFSAHQQEDFLTISKLTLLFFLVPILKEFWQFETSRHFFGTPCTVRCQDMYFMSNLNFYIAKTPCQYDKKEIFMQLGFVSGPSFFRFRN